MFIMFTLKDDSWIFLLTGGRCDCSVSFSVAFVHIGKLVIAHV